LDIKKCSHRDEDIHGNGFSLSVVQFFRRETGRIQIVAEGVALRNCESPAHGRR
jgi:hypothetical protein